MHTTRRQRPSDLAGPVLVAGLTGLVLLGPCLWKAAEALAQEGRIKAYGKHLAQECTGCHRIDGIDNGIPSIIGWQADLFIVTLKFYRSGTRTNPVMVSVANSLDEKQLEALATYFGSLPKPSPKGKRPGK
jgi:cytochrome c